MQAISPGKYILLQQNSLIDRISAPIKTTAIKHILNFEIIIVLSLSDKGPQQSFSWSNPFLSQRYSFAHFRADGFRVCCV